MIGSMNSPNPLNGFLCGIAKIYNCPANRENRNGAKSFADGIGQGKVAAVQ